jgi:hypothetical protein
MIQNRIVAQALSALTLIVAGAAGTALAHDAPMAAPATATLSQATAIDELSNFGLDEFGATTGGLVASAGVLHNDDDSWGQHHHHENNALGGQKVQLGEFDV